MSVLLALALAAGVPAADLPLSDPQAEARATQLMESIRCLVCEGQSIVDSDADMARDMRALVRGRISDGESPDAVRDWLVARYGRQVSYRPPFDATGALLWLAPVLLLGAGAIVARASFRRRR